MKNNDWWFCRYLKIKKKQYAETKEPYINRFVTYDFRIYDYNSWALEEISKRPYLSVLLPLPQLTEETFGVILGQMNILDFNAFIEGRIGSWTLILSEDDSYCFEKPITADIDPADFYAIAKNQSYQTRDIYRGVYSCWYHGILVTSYSDFLKAKGLFRGIGRESIKNPQICPLRTKIARMLQKEEIKLQHIAVAELAYLLYMSSLIPASIKN